MNMHPPAVGVAITIIVEMEVVYYFKNLLGAYMVALRGKMVKRASYCWSTAPAHCSATASPSESWRECMVHFCTSVNMHPHQHSMSAWDSGGQEEGGSYATQGQLMAMQNRLTSLESQLQAAFGQISNLPSRSEVTTSVGDTVHATIDDAVEAKMAAHCQNTKFIK